MPQTSAVLNGILQGAPLYALRKWFQPCISGSCKWEPYHITQWEEKLKDNRS